MLEEYIIKNGKKLRCGYTTGSCAAAAAGAAVRMLYSGAVLDRITIDTPRGWKLDLAVGDAMIADGYAECSITKDAGDDPDVTNGIKIYARARKSGAEGITISGGIGVGVVTRKGLPVEVGRPAINPVPLRMINDEIQKAKPSGGIEVEISAPDGVHIAKKTFNPRLGIEGGISILGTTGIVEPMSRGAIRDSIALEISMARAAGLDTIVLCPGNYGRDFAAGTLGIDEKKIVIVGNFVGDMLEAAVFHGMKQVLLVGHIGKMIKIAGGIFNTHSRYADARLEIMAAHYARLTGDGAAARRIMESNTTDDALEHIRHELFFRTVADEICRRCVEFVHGALAVECVIFSQQKGLLAMSHNAASVVDHLRRGR